MSVPLIEDYKKASADVWTWFKKNYEAKDADDWWMKLYDSSNRLCEKYTESPIKEYVIEYVVLCMSDIHRRWKARK